MADNNLSPNGQSHLADNRPVGVPLRQDNDGPATPKDSTAVDLAAWGRGEREYPWAEVQKAIDDYAMAEIEKIIQARFAGITDRAAAVDLLVEEGIIEPGQARRDV